MLARNNVTEKKEQHFEKQRNKSKKKIRSEECVFLAGSEFYLGGVERAGI
jgi:hypothetical protein